MTDTPLARLSSDDRFALDDMYQAYAATLDERRYDEWPSFFAPDALYRIVPRENHELNLPVALMHCEGRLMMADRVVALQETVMMRPRSLRRFITPARILGGDGSAQMPLQVRANVLLVETLHERLTQVVLSGVFHDTVVRTADHGPWQLASRSCIYDSLLLPDSLVEPV
ncbi:nuclear transport factor 2 family protein [Hydrogenophaga sp.]|uniref:aromatic-ring-hydroxylating dioxygenase subunit beta n=1 Tax=Hydrogenophaga sp. TaxID=1904254 RepID=UPI002722FB07|nr:nuclear transport factor 2 family protein [Hydrogenophaga sp.]MDO9434401.1 aromatic-ring-hydroxylating dioxygenase subunit beta [Hydrogenophaga sp.]